VSDAGQPHQLWIFVRVGRTFTHNPEQVRCQYAGGYSRHGEFDNQDLTDAEFRECDLTRARMIGVVMRDAVIDGLVDNLVVNGVEVTSYVEAELDRRQIRAIR
jgi:hypothetical protein